MIKYLMTLFVFFFCVQYADVWASLQQKHYGIKCSPQLQSCLKAIQKLPEAKNLIDAILSKGPLQILAKKAALAQQFGACWDPSDRIILIDLSSHRSEGELIGSILFELHNALTTSEFDRLDALAENRQISKNKYVESKERLEYENSLQAAAMAEKGIQSKLIPASSRLHVYDSFKEYYYYQKKSGHSANFLEAYDRLASKKF